MKRTALGQALKDGDYDQLLQDLIAGTANGEVNFSLEDLARGRDTDPPVSLISIGDLKHVNALSSAVPLTCGPAGITIVYGDNGSGKSGYARLLKHAIGARHREEILSDVFQDSPLDKPVAAIKARVGVAERLIEWPRDGQTELSRMHFYDQACGALYVSDEYDFPYRPSALHVMDQLITACLAVRERIESALGRIRTERAQLPIVDGRLKHSRIGSFIENLSARSSEAELDSIIASHAENEGERLAQEERMLFASDTKAYRQRLTRHIERLARLRDHLRNVSRRLAPETMTSIASTIERIRSLQTIAASDVAAFNSQPVSGVGTDPWKALWESARRYSITLAYPENDFPFVGNDARCVLCQQRLDADAAGRLARFEAFIQADTQMQLRKSRTELAEAAERIGAMEMNSDAIDEILNELTDDFPEIVTEVRARLLELQALRDAVYRAITEGVDIPSCDAATSELQARIETSIEATKKSLASTDSVQATQTRLAQIAAEKLELELWRQVSQSRPVILEEISRRKAAELLEELKSAAATTGITKKIVELSETSITDVVRDTFTRETDRMRLERVTIQKIRAEKGALLHQPRLVGARQAAELPQVFSEGERTALGLAAFFTEALLDKSGSALILDDPVSSLDHVRRSQVSQRIAALAQTRQVIVFTHDVSFVADLRREAEGLGVSICERSVVKARGANAKPGGCSDKHPWKAKDVPQRLQSLKDQLAAIRKNSAEWQEDQYEKEISDWAGGLSETWERIFSQELISPILADGGLEVRPAMVKVLSRFTQEDEAEFTASYSRVSQWVKRHDKAARTNYVAPDAALLAQELEIVERWFKRIKKYRD